MGGGRWLLVGVEKSEEMEVRTVDVQSSPQEARSMVHWGGKGNAGVCAKKAEDSKKRRGVVCCERPLPVTT